MNLGLKSLMLSTLFAAALSQVARPSGQHTAKQYRNQSFTLDGQLTLGERVYRFLEASHGQDFALTFADKHQQKKLKEGQGRPATRATTKDGLPRGFWHSFVTQEMHLDWTKALQMKASRAFGAYLDQTGSQPTMTRVAARGDRKGTSCRNSGGAYNALKGAGGLGHALLQWFVDELGQLKVRSDAQMLLQKAREMKQWLINAEGIPADSLPKLERNNSGYKWLQRWRKFYNISKRHHWNRLKVSWKKIKARCYVHLTNIFRLTISHPVTEIRGVPSRMEPSGFRWSGRSLTCTG